MFKMIGLLKRRPGMSSGEFRAYYESTHRRIGEKYLRKYACNYMRRYLTPFPNPLTGETPEAQLVQQIDRLEMAMQAAVYQKKMPWIDLAEFFTSSRERVVDPMLLNILDEAQRLAQEGSDEL